MRSCLQISDLVSDPNPLESPSSSLIVSSLGVRFSGIFVAFCLLYRLSNLLGLLYGMNKEKMMCPPEGMGSQTSFPQYEFGKQGFM